MNFHRLFATGACLLACACGGHDKKSEATENTCAPSVSYATVGEPFLEKHCLRCHGAGVGKALGGGHVFDSEAELAEHGHDAYENVEMNAMPPDRALSDSEKAPFLEWLECSGLAAAHGEHTH